MTSFFICTIKSFIKSLNFKRVHISTKTSATIPYFMCFRLLGREAQARIIDSVTSWAHAKAKVSIWLSIYSINLSIYFINLFLSILPIYPSFILIYKSIHLYYQSIYTINLSIYTINLSL